MALTTFGRVSAGSASLIDTAVSSGNPLATEDQLALEDLAMRLFRSRPVQDARERSHRIMQADPRANTASGKATLALDLNELAFNACAIAAADNPDDPKIYWGINLPHHWFGRDVPGSRCGIDNPDNAYRLMAIDDQSSYFVTGRVPSVPPVDVSFTVFPVWPGAKNLFVRDSMSDWSSETPLYLSIKRVSGPPLKPPRDEDALSRIAAECVDLAARFWLDLPSHYYYRGEVNRLVVVQNPSFATRGGQFTANGNFKLAPDEAYVLTLDPLGVRYVGLQLADLYGASLDYAHHTASLSRAQVTPNNFRGY
ncbi:MAG: hypothetical protein ABI771_13590 [Betaproteobacteria bacterium]